MFYFTSLVSVNSFVNTVFMAHVDYDSKPPILDKFSLPSVFVPFACYSIRYFSLGTVRYRYRVPISFVKLILAAFSEVEKYSTGIVHVDIV